MHPAPVSRASILIVDDEKSVRLPLQRILRNAKHLHFAANATQALRCLQRHAIDLAFVDIVLPDMSGIELLKKLRPIEPHTPVIMATTVQDIQTAVDAMKAGAFDFLTAPFDGDHVRSLVKQALGRQHERIPIKRHPAMETVPAPESMMGTIHKLIEALSPYESNVLIQGASSTLARTIAHAMHESSARGTRPYLSINCAGRPPKHMERDLFGPRFGAAAGALTARSGIIERAHTGSLFLNNINYLSLDSQARLLRIIQHKALDQPKYHRSIKADIRFIAATDQNLKALVDAHLFRKDLYDRLNMLPIDLPLLSARGGDLGLLLEHFLKQRDLRKREPHRPFTPCAASTPKACNWPGNVREFEHLLERLFTLHAEGAQSAGNLPEDRSHIHPNPFEGLDLKKATRAFERQHILAALEAFDGHRSDVARHLGIHRNTLLMKTKALGIDFR